MDGGEHNGKNPIFLMDDLGGILPLFLEKRPIWIMSYPYQVCTETMPKIGQ